MSKFANVKGHPGLVRDKGSGAILNINSKEIKEARKRKKAWKKEQERVDNLEKDMNEIKTLLHKILEVTDGRNND
jgi:hypothetical protein